MGEAQAAAAEAAPAAEKLPAEGTGKRNKRKRRREVQPPERRCPACAEFLANRKTQEIPCMQCGTPIFWPPESQLQTHLGNWAAPSICGACKLIQVTAARDAAREILRHQHPGPVEQPPAAPAAATPEPPAEG
jgi:ribosomal protein S27AE